MRVTRPTARPAFTLTEMMVATALCLFLMLVISQAFGAATKTFQTVRTAGQLQERLRGGITVIRRDLASDHFGPLHGTLGGPKLSNQQMHLLGWTPPEVGYFEMGLPGVASGVEHKGSSFAEPYLSPAADGDGLYSTRAVMDVSSLTQYGLRFTVRVPAGVPGELFSAEFEPSARLLGDARINEFPDPTRPVIYSRWAEVTYFLERLPEGPGPHTPVHTLYRRVRLLAPTSGGGIDIPYDNPAAYPAFPGKTPSSLIADRYPDVAIEEFAGGFRFLGPADVTDRVRRLRMEPAARLNRTTGLAERTGSDILMTDVISFEVKATWYHNPILNVPSIPGDYGGTSPDPAQLQAGPLGRTHPWLFTDGPFFDVPASSTNRGSYAAWFDTWGPVQSHYIPPDNRKVTYVVSDYLDWADLSCVWSPVALHKWLQPPLRVNVRALQIKIRIWDPRAEKARQVTIVQEV
ncbi:MAG TPA: hypothetical protein VM597_35085 [Gemmataceae bacterium]|nr:hypothetical protein [Gemmataceae bacterium]